MADEPDNPTEGQRLVIEACDQAESCAHQVVTRDAERLAEVAAGGTE
jgi:hypothetical protein